VSGDHAGPPTLLVETLRHPIGNPNPDPQSLPVRQHNAASDHPNVLRSRVWEMDVADERHRLIVDERHETLGGRLKMAAQIVMRTKQGPRLTADRMDRELDAWSGLNRPPLEDARMRLEHPIRLQPVGSCATRRSPPDDPPPT
jgi:hypothetical protein